MRDYLKPLELHCCGTPEKSTDWMMALNAHTGGELLDHKGEWTGKCKLVDPLINRLCLQVAAGIGDNEERTRDVMNFGFFRPLYTCGTFQDTIRRGYAYADCVVRRWLPPLIDQHLRPDMYVMTGKYWKKLPPIVDHESALLAQCALWTLTPSFGGPIASGMANVLCRVCSAMTILTACGTYGNDAIRANACLSAVCQFQQMDTTHAKLLGIEWREYHRQYVYPLLGELCELGPHKLEEEIPEPVCGIDVFHRLCGVQS